MTTLVFLVLWGGQSALSHAPILSQVPQAEAAAAEEPRHDQGVARSTYVLGADDVIEVRAVDAELGEKPLRIDVNGDVKLPMLGRFRAAGLTIEQLESTISERLKTYVRRPDVTVWVVEYRSQPVSVFGAVKNPGVHQLQGRKTLIEVLSLAGGLDQDAGARIKLSRRLEWGRIPLKNAADDASGEFSVAEVGVKRLMEAAAPEENILIRPHDVISVPRADLVYVSGQVQRSGGFVLNDRETITVLQALSLAGGLERTASPGHARILRRTSSSSRTELAVDVKKILEGKRQDVPMIADDILFIPTSAPKRAALRAVETAIQIGTGVVIWRR